MHGQMLKRYVCAGIVLVAVLMVVPNGEPLDTYHPEHPTEDTWAELQWSRMTSTNHVSTMLPNSSWFQSKYLLPSGRRLEVLERDMEVASIMADTGRLPRMSRRA